MQTYRRTTNIEVEASALEKWHLSPGAFQRLSPPWERMRVIEEPEAITDGARAVIEVKSGPLWQTWVAEHQDCRPGSGFSDLQIKGPFAYWKHVHSFNSTGPGTCDLVDHVDYKLPIGFMGKVLGSRFVRRKLERTFAYRHATTKMDLERMATEPPTESMKLLVTGATGMIGSALEAYLRMRGHDVRRVTRHPQRPDDVRWDPKKGEIDLPADERIDGVVHLAGEGIAGGRWTEARKARILESRRVGTRLLCEALAARGQRPAVLVSASGANFYATGTPQPQDESSPRGTGFLSDVCEVWENETAAAKTAGIRVVNLRLGIVISPAGGALAKMLPAFKLGTAGRLGSGTQKMPWIALDDVIDITHRALHDDRYNGPINAVAPERITNAEFTKILAKTLGRPALIPVPAKALKVAFGDEMAEETLLADLSIAPSRLCSLGYPFRFPTMDAALTHLLGRS